MRHGVIVPLLHPTTAIPHGGRPPELRIGEAVIRIEIGRLRVPATA